MGTVEDARDLRRNRRTFHRPLSVNDRKRKDHPETHPTANMSSQPLLQTAPGKRIALPTRVEPKVFFANERTFLSWLNFTVVLGGLAVGLLNFGDRVGKISAGMFTFVAMSIMIYALVTYHWRANAIRKRGSGPYDDRLGPTVLCLALFAAVVTNFILRFTASCHITAHTLYPTARRPAPQRPYSSSLPGPLVPVCPPARPVPAACVLACVACVLACVRAREVS